MKKIFFFIFFTTTLSLNATLNFDKVIIWGHKLHSHTHSYIHYAFHKAFSHLGYDTYWFDNDDDVSTFDFSSSLFFSEGQADQKMPLHEDCFYIVHNWDRAKYQHLANKGRCIALQVYTLECESEDLTKMHDYVLYNLDKKDICMPWATDLLPHEIDEIKKNIGTTKREPIVYWIGSLCLGLHGNLHEVQPFVNACTKHGIQFNHETNMGMEESRNAIQKSILAPAIQGKWQCDTGYIPCRIFKHISYGHMGITNNKTVYELFNKKIVFNTDTYQLFYDALERVENLEQENLFELMDFVKTKHTYINRIQCLLTFLEMAYEDYTSKTQNITTLDQYKTFLKEGTYAGQDWSSFATKPLSRYHTFKIAFEHFEQHTCKVIVELGTTRSFVHGGLPGCNCSDPTYWTPYQPENWDWGAGCFTRVAAECLAHTQPALHTIDINPEHIERCKLMTEDFEEFIQYHVCSSLDFLQNCDLVGQIDLLYLDTGDMTPIEPTALLQLEEAKLIVARNLLSKNGIILIDDVRNQTPKQFGETSDLGKAKYSIPFLLQHGFEIVEDEYQVILRKKAKDK